MYKDKVRAREYARVYQNKRNARLKDSPEFKKRNIEKTMKRRKKIIEFLENYKRENPCKCGESDIACLEFHHVGQKEIHISEIPQRGWGMARLMEELNKCVVMCANCHRKLHYTISERRV